MSLLAISYLRSKVETALDDTDLQAIIDDEEAEVNRRFGQPGDGSTAVSETLAGGGGELFLSRPFVSISSVSERLSLSSSDVMLTASDYLTWPEQGRITRMTTGRTWGARVVVTYIPVDERPRRRQVLTELVRLTLQQTAMKSESVAGEYSYTAPDWDAARQALYQRLKFVGV